MNIFLSASSPRFLISEILLYIDHRALFEEINNVNRVQGNISKRPGSWSSWL